VAQIDSRDASAAFDAAEASRILRELNSFGQVLAVKLYRLTLDPAPSIPTLPCLDHEAMLHEGVAPHLAAYIQDGSSGDIHEVVVIPSERRIEEDIISTWGECSPESRARLLAIVKQRFPNYKAEEATPSWWRGDRRVATACRAQVTLRDVLLGPDIARVKDGVDRLQTIASLMEKQSRAASWGVRTVSGPLVAAGGVIIYIVFGALSFGMSESAVAVLRYLLIGLLGGWFLYYGVKAVQLTEMSNRVWKRTAEYNLILSERRRLGI
jgi:hypothetical protein